MTELSNTKILLIGAGKMGGALLGAWLSAGASPENITVVETNAEQVKTLGVRVITSIKDVPQTDCIVLAVKPQSMDGVLAELKASSRRKPGSQASALDDENTPLYLSIAAGKTLAYYQQHLGNVAIVRAMPNTPVLVGRGITALCANDKVTENQKEFSNSLLNAAGEVVWLQDESQMDAVTAISGSGPAYVFLFMEALIEAGKAHGLPEEMCIKLALNTVRGSAKLAMKSDESLAQLRKNVTSPGGTTEAALNVLMKKDGLQTLVNDAVKAAIKRAKELR